MSVNEQTQNNGGTPSIPGVHFEMASGTAPQQPVHTMSKVEQILGSPVGAINPEARKFYAKVARATGGKTGYQMAAELEGKEYKTGVWAGSKRLMNKRFKMWHGAVAVGAGALVLTLTHKAVANKFGWSGVWGNK